MNNYRDYEDDENSLVAESIVGVGKLDWLIALAVAACVYVMLWLWSYPGVYPAAWDDLVVAVGARPPQSVVPGLWRYLSWAFFKAVGVANGLAAYKTLGHVFGAASVALVYVFFRQCLSISIRYRRQMARRCLLAVRIAATVAAVSFASSEPFWRVSQMFTSSTFLLFMAVSAMTLFSMFLRNGSMSSVYFCAFLAGVIAAESPLGSIGVIVALSAYWFITRYGEEFATPLVNPATAQVSKWHITFIFVVGCLSTACLNSYSFFALGGLQAIGDPGLSVLPLKYINNYVALFTRAATLVGWLFLSVMIILPWFVSAAMLPKATDEEHFLAYGIGLVYVVACLFAISQLCPVEGLWIWNWQFGGEDIVSSQLLMLMMAMLAAASVMCAIVVLGVDGFCRDHRFIAQQQFGFSPSEADVDDEVYVSKPKRLSRKAEARVGKLSRIVVASFMLLVVPAVTVPSRYCGKAREMMDAVNDYIDLVLRETEGRSFLVSDGRFDAGLEVAALAKGRRLYPLSVMSGRGAYDSFVRLRGITDGEDRLAAAIGAPALLRTWIRDNEQALTNCCAQIGFEFWKRDGRPLPVMLGVVARPCEKDAAFVAGCVEARDALAKKVLDFYGHRRNIASNDRLIERLFETVQWRLARIARFRGEEHDLAGDVKGAKEEVALGDSLDNRNEALRELLETLERINQNARHRLTPREGLRQALADANFALASQYADSILKSHPEDPDANFAMGMLFFHQRQYSRAEDHLSRCLVLSPREPAVYNNLAMIQMYLCKFDAAAKNAKRALELAPGSAEILDTIKQIAEAREAAATNALPASVGQPAPQAKSADKAR